MSKKPKKLNVQGLARRAPELMRTIVARPGHVFVSSDVQAAEPSITAHFSGDKNYRYAVLEGIGKEPFYSPDGLLMIDDIYLMVMSKSPIGRVDMRKAFDADYEGRTFSQQWVIDKSPILASLKHQRAMHKIMCLGFAYSMGAKTAVSHAYAHGYIVSFADAKAFHKSYWDTFSGVRAFSNRCTKIVDRDGVLVNPFGYRCSPSPHKAFNAFVQSSVSGLINVLCMKVFTLAGYSRLVSILHDEIITEVPESMLDKYKQDLDVAVASLNEDLSWSVNIRVGFVAGKDFYEAK